MGVLILILRILALVLVAVSAKWTPPTGSLFPAGVAVWMLASILEGTHF